MFRFFPALAVCVTATIACAETTVPADLLQSLPMRFEAVATGNFRYQARGAGYGVGLSNDAVVLAAGDRALRLSFPNSDVKAPFTGAAKSSTLTNYFHGNDRESAPAWGQVRRTGLYPGVDIVFYGKGGSLEYDFELAPGADPSVIAMKLEGADRVSLTPSGDLMLEAGKQTLTQKLPVVYQRRSENEVASVASSYVLGQDGIIRLKLAAYDVSLPLVVDPSIVMTAFLPGTGGEGVVGIARDARGFQYLAGYTYSSTDFAMVGNSYSPFMFNSLKEGWIMKIDPFASGNELIIYSSYIGGNGTDDVKAFTVDSRGLVAVSGVTDSAEFPISSGAFRTTYGDFGTKVMFFSVLDTTRGKDGLVYSTFFGGTKSEEPTAIAAGANGLFYMTGWTTSDDFPVGGAYSTTRSGSYDAFITVFDTTKTSYDSLRYSSYFGGSGQDVARSIAAGPDGAAYITGATYSVDFPTSLGAYRQSYSGLGDAFVTGIDINTNELKYSTYLGGRDSEQARKIIVQPDGNLAVTGYTFSDNFPITQNAAQPIAGGNADAFVTVLNPRAQNAGSLVYSTYLGGSGGDVAYDLRRDASGKYYFCGYTTSPNFPLKNPLQEGASEGGSDGFVAVINPVGSQANGLVYSSLISGTGAQVATSIEVDDSEGLITVTGTSTGTLFPQGQAQPTIPSNTNVFILGFKL